MLDSSHVAGSATRFAPSISRALSAFGGALVNFGKKTNEIIFSVQSARMMATLSAMTDHQLEQLGIERSDIPKYAEFLMKKN